MQPRKIAAITGHASLKEIVRYTNTVDRKRLARSAREKMKRGTFSVKPIARFDKSGKTHEKTAYEFSVGSPGRIRNSDQPVNRGIPLQSGAIPCNNQKPGNRCKQATCAGFCNPSQCMQSCPSACFGVDQSVDHANRLVGEAHATTRANGPILSRYQSQDWT
jgi:hypothetical protein